MNGGQNSYTVDLDIFNGPLDLLLYLIRKNEIDIYDIPIARITDQYLQYVEALRFLNINIVGDFLVMAATLMYIKSYMLLPHTEIKEEEEEDPRLPLVKQLLEYKRYKEGTLLLCERAKEWEKRMPRTLPYLRAEVQDKKGEDIPLDGINIWNLLNSFSKLMKQTLLHVPATITYDDTPINEYMDMVLQKVHLQTKISFRNLFEGLKERRRIIGFFLALLELVRLKKIHIEQLTDYSDIQISVKQT